MKNRLFSAIISAAAALTLAAPLVASTGCAADLEFHDHNGRAYNHRHYHDEEVYQHEDGGWYAKRHESWVKVDVQ